MVTLWDPLTSELRGTLSCSEFSKTAKGSLSRVEFVGQDGRYLVGTGAKKGVVVWDLVKGSVHWAAPEQAVDHIAIHPTSSVFTVSEAPLTATTTTFTVFSAHSATPIRSRTLPFRARSVAAYPSATDSTAAGPVASTSTAPVAAEDSNFSLLVVSSTWDVLVVGDEVVAHSLASDSAQAVNLASSNATSVGRSMFEEIFGPSTTPDDRKAKENERAVRIASDQWKSLDDLFDAPAQVLPGMGLIFGEVLDGLLPKRTEQGEQEPITEDGMEIDEDEIIVPAKEDDLKARVVGEAEMDTLVGLFKDILSSPAPPPPPPTPKQVNGKLPPTPKINGAAAASTPKSVTVNGTPSKATPIANGSGKKTLPPSSLSKDVSMESPVSAKGTPSGAGGKKRKSKD